MKSPQCKEHTQRTWQKKRNWRELPVSGHPHFLRLTDFAVSAHRDLRDQQQQQLQLTTLTPELPKAPTESGFPLSFRIL